VNDRKKGKGNRKGNGKGKGDGKDNGKGKGNSQNQYRGLSAAHHDEAHDAPVEMTDFVWETV
jgi:hypothetical protein